MPEIEPHEKEAQIAAAMAALAVAFVQTLREQSPGIDPLEILQRKAQVELSRLRKDQDANLSVALFRFVTEQLRNPNVIDQPADG